jgi:large subunit ribosomal protein L4
MKLSVVNLAGAAQGEAEIADEVLIHNGKGSQAVHDTVVAYLANQRLGTVKTKMVNEVKGSGKKPWRQKGTGRARAGSHASPIWRGGGVVFGPRPRDFSQKVPRKVRSLAFRKALSERLLAGDLVVVDSLEPDSPKTKPFLAQIDELTADAVTVLVVADVVGTNLRLATRNVARVDVEAAESLNVYELLRYDKLVVSRAALDKLTARLGKS